MRKILFIGILTFLTILVFSCEKSHPKYVYYPESTGWGGIPVLWEDVVKARTNYYVKSGMSYDEANKKAKDHVATYQSAD